MPRMGKDTFVRIRTPGGAGGYIMAPVLTTTQRDALTAEEGMIIFNSTTDQLEEYDGATWQAIGQVILTTHEADFGLHTKVVRKTADQTVHDSTTLVSDTELLLAVAASEVWRIEFNLVGNSGTTPDFKWGFAVPSGTTFYSNSVHGATYQWNSASWGTPTLEGKAGDGMYKIVAVFIVSTTAGNIILQWAQYTQDNSDTKVLTGSCLVATKLA